MCMEPEERQAWADEVDCLKESELAEVEQDFGQAWLWMWQMKALIHVLI